LSGIAGPGSLFRRMAALVRFDSHLFMLQNFACGEILERVMGIRCERLPAHCRPPMAGYSSPVRRSPASIPITIFQKYVNIHISLSANVNLERVMGIEPTSQAWEARILPLNYTRNYITNFKFHVSN
jgi:hypothetical protein